MWQSCHVDAIDDGIFEDHTDNFHVLLENTLYKWELEFRNTQIVEVWSFAQPSFCIVSDLIDLVIIFLSWLKA